jgi:hypothetical protein
MTLVRKASTSKPICIRIGEMTILVRRADVSVAQVVVIGAPRDAAISVSNEDVPPSQ